MKSPRTLASEVTRAWHPEFNVDDRPAPLFSTAVNTEIHVVQFNRLRKDRQRPVPLVPDDIIELGVQRDQFLVKIADHNVVGFFVELLQPLPCGAGLVG